MEERDIKNGANTVLFSNHVNDYVFDSAYREKCFRRLWHPDPLFQMSSRELDGADKMIAYFDEGMDQMPVVDGDPLEAGLNQYSSFSGSAVSYDPNGSRLSSPGFNYFYDYSNRLVEIRQSNNTLFSRYVYASDNRRVLRGDTNPISVTRYLYDGWQVLEERDVMIGGDSVLRQYVDGRELDDHIQIKDGTQSGEPVYYYHCNSQGSTGALTDLTGSLVERYTYGWLGRTSIVSPSGSSLLSSLVGNRYRFQGCRQDFSAGGLYYYRNRYYSPLRGEFLTIDPQGTTGTEASGYAKASDVASRLNADSVKQNLGIWHHGQGNGYSAFAEDGWNNSDPHGLFWGPVARKIIEWWVKRKAKKEAAKRAICEAARPSGNQVKHFRRIFEQSGKSGLEKSRRSIQNKMAEHVKKIRRAKRRGGYTSSMEREMRNWRRELQAIEEILRNN